MSLLTRACKLFNTLGEYWRFHNEGNSAVSTIEAIAYAAKGAGMCEESYDALLVLFRLQQLRVFENIDVGDKKVPRAIKVNGFGLGEWEV